MGWREYFTKDNRSGRTAEEEVKKQFWDQILHFLWGFFTGFPTPTSYWTLGWKALVIAVLWLAASNAIWIIRERNQAKDGSHWPPDPKWDKTAYYLGQAVGLVVGILAAVFISLAKSS